MGAMTSADEEAGPEPKFEDYANRQDYLVAWRVWRTVHREWRQTAYEASTFRIERMARAMGLPEAMIQEVLARP